MALTRSKDFIESLEGQDIRRELEEMTDDNSYHTASTYSPNTAKYPDNRMPFADIHMNYLIAHPKLAAAMYLSNVKMRCRVR